jgi:lipopolysaccharide transport system permease protein
MAKTIIDSSSSSLKLKELIQFKELFWMLAWRDFKVRYAQTAIGFLWAFIQPAFTILILYVIFGRFAQVDTGGIPHILFTAVGLLPWTYFSYVMQNSGNSIIAAQAMVKKVYFPRIIIPISKAVVGLIDLGISALIVVFLMLIYKQPVTMNLLFLPLFLLIAIVVSLGVGIWLSSLSIRFRDFQYVVPFMVQLGLYITPTAYPAEFALTQLPDWAAFIYFLNPMVGIVEGFRWSILGLSAPHLYSYISFVASLILFISSLFYFRKIDGKIADLV